MNSLINRKVKPTKSILRFYIDNARSLTTNGHGLVESQFDEIMEFVLFSIIFPNDIYGIINKKGFEGSWHVQWYNTDGSTLTSAYYEKGRDFELL